MDGIGSDGNLNLVVISMIFRSLIQMAWTIAVEQGFTVPFENCLFSSSHSHSGSFFDFFLI